MTSGAPAARQHFPELESLRGLAALSVVLYHCPPWVPAIHAIPAVRNGVFAVSFFFVLSGFVIHHAYADRLKSAADVRRFLFLRLGRIYPLYLFFLAVFIALDGIGAVFGRAPVTDFDSAETALAQLFLLQPVKVEWALAFNVPSWSVSVEFWVYAVFAVVAVCGLRRQVWAFAALAAVGLGTVLTQLVFFPILFEGLGGFFVGAVLGHVLKRLHFGPRLPWLAPVAFAALAVLLSMRHYPAWFAFAVLPPLTAALIAGLLVDRNGLLGRALRRAPLPWLGQLSFSIYLSHSLVLLAADLASARLGYPMVRIDNDLVPKMPLLAGSLMYLAVFAATLALSWTTYRWIEAPCRAWSRKVAG